MGSLTFRFTSLLLVLSALGCEASPKLPHITTPVSIHQNLIVRLTVVEVRPRVDGPLGAFGFCTVVAEDEYGNRFPVPETVYKNVRPGDVIYCRGWYIPLFLDQQAWELVR